MKATTLTFLLLASLGLVPQLGAQPVAAPVQMARSFEHRITSAAVGDSFVIRVRIPESYEQSTGRFPVAYVLDADIWFGLATDIADNLPAHGETPEVVVVGIAHGGTVDNWWQKRARDFLPACRRTAPPPDLPLAGGAEKFQEFLAAELFPFIEGHYRVLPDNRTLVGFSGGGTFAAHTLFTRPELFHRYVIIAPSLWWDEEQIFATEELYHSRNAKLSAIVFCAIGDSDDPATSLPRWQRFNKLVAGRQYEGLRWTSHVCPDETHLSTFPTAFTRGLKVVYAAATTTASARATEPVRGD
jgi:uncharacterized protein